MRKNVLIVLLLVLKVLFSCTGIYIANENVKLFGLNEDFYNYNTIYKTLPASENNYGLIAFGHSNSIQAIINDQGLIYDGYGAPFKEMINSENLPQNNGTFIFEALTTCSNLEEVVTLFNQFHHPWLQNSQFFIADKEGNSAIFEGDTILIKSGDYQICTNFYQSDPESGIEDGFYPCPRFDFLENSLSQASSFSIDYASSLLDSVHVENQGSPFGPISSVYSLVIDQINSQIHVVNMYDFENKIVLNMNEEFGKPMQSSSLGSLFTTKIDDQEIKISDSALYQNYPNPFNPETTINYALNKDQFVFLAVYNSKGQLVKELINGFTKAGNHKMNFNGEHLNSGVYYYRLKAGNKISAKKMILCK